MPVHFGPSGNFVLSTQPIMSNEDVGMQIHAANLSNIYARTMSEVHWGGPDLRSSRYDYSPSSILANIPSE